jgi:hypothetical protein
MTRRNSLLRLAVPAVIAAVLVSVTACSSDPARETTDPTAGSTASPSAGLGGAAGSNDDDPYTALLARFDGCESAGAAFGTALDGLVLSEGSTFTADRIQCQWVPQAVDATTSVLLVGFSAQTNWGQEDVPTQQKLDDAGETKIPAPAVEAIGGVVHVSKTGGQDRTRFTSVSVPDLDLSLLQSTINEQPTLWGEGAVPTINALLGIG